jgi:hypothetical protein
MVSIKNIAIHLVAVDLKQQQPEIFLHIERILPLVGDAF